MRISDWSSDVCSSDLVGETLNLAVAQLATDVPGRPANMNNGNPDVEAILYRWEGGRFAERRRFACPGGEDALCFRSGGASYPAFASICTAGEPHAFNANSPIRSEERRVGNEGVSMSRYR